MMRISSLVLALLLCAASSYAEVQVLEDFEDGSYEGPGTLVADPEDSGNTCLFLDLVGDGYANAEVYELDVSELATGGAGTVTMDIFDMGKYLDGSGYGARWGIEGEQNSLGFGIVEKGWLGCEAGYGINGSEYDNQSALGVRTGDWWSAVYSGTREIDALDVDATAAVSGADGAWATWSFTVDENGYVTEVKSNDRVRYTQDGGASSTLPGWVGDLEDVWVSAGRNNTFGLEGVYVDNVTFDGGEPDFIPGDANGDDIVNLDDFIILKQNYGINGTWEQGDFDGNGVINLDDFIILKQNYGNTAS